MKVKSLIKQLYLSPIGKIQIISSNKGIVRIDYTWDSEVETSQDANSSDANNDNNAYSNLAINQLSEYFSGNRLEFNLQFDLQGTEFQNLVWKEMLKIPYGKTMTYGEIAKSIGRPKASRAVGMACNRNPLIIIVPCHRVIGSSGSLTGYAGGILKKQWLLDHENAI